jgi:predicted PurR-regulated permease PerM
VNVEGDKVSEGVRFSRQAKIVILLAGAGLFLWLLLRAQSVLGPFLWGAIAAYIFTPLVDFLETRTRLRRTLVVVLLYLIGLAVTVWASTAFIPLVVKQAGELLSDMPRILTGLLGSLDFASQYLQAEQLEPFGLTVDPQVLVNEAVRGMQNLFTYLTRQAIPAVFNVLEGLGQVILCLIVAFYLLRSARSVRARLERLIPRPYRREALDLLSGIDRVLGAYIRGQLLLVGVMAVVTIIALSILHVRYALVIGLFSGLLSIVPLFGPIVGGAVAVSVALFQPTTPFGWSNLTLALAVVVAYTVLRQIEDQFVVPNLVGPIVDLHPLLVLFALFAGGKIAGFTGLVTAVPVAAALKIIVIYLYGKIWEEPSGEDLAPDSSLATLPEPPPAPSGETP